MLYHAMTGKKNAVRAYNHGPSAPGEVVTGGYYWFETNSPSWQLDTDEEFFHNQCILHVNADNRTLAYLVEAVFGIDYEQIYRKIMG